MERKYLPRWWIGGKIYDLSLELRGVLAHTGHERGRN